MLRTLLLVDAGDSSSVGLWALASAHSVTTVWGGAHGPVGGPTLRGAGWAIRAASRNARTCAVRLVTTVPIAAMIGSQLVTQVRTWSWP